MKRMLNKVWRSAVALLLAVCMFVGTGGTALAAGMNDVISTENDTINYVSLGASQTNGYGMRYYLPEEVYADPYTANKDELNVYGYQSKVDAAYPALVKAAIEETSGKKVNLDQLAISSMRAEELHVLLDNDYYGDAYTNWRFYKVEDGVEKGWFAQAEEGGLAALREAYQTAITNADLITVDIGVNNFGVYTINQITSGGTKYDSDVSKLFDEDKLEIYNSVKKAALEILGSDAADYEYVIDTLAYALVGFMVNFDASMEKIYKLNPDATVVAVAIPNMMAGTEIAIEGSDKTLPLGNVYGMFVDIANLYVSSQSPYCEKYLYASTGETGSVELFLDEILTYNGDPTTLSTNMKDCFDVYDTDLAIRSKIQYGVFNGDTTAAGYEAALNAAYDVVATIMQEAAKINVLDLNAMLSDMDEAEDKLMKYIESSVEAEVIISQMGEKSDFVMDETLFEDPAVATVAALGVRFMIGNSFFGHPDENGHIHIKDAIIKALDEEIYGQTVAEREMEKTMNAVYNWLEEEGYIAEFNYAYDSATAAGYKATDASYYVALGDSTVTGLGQKKSSRITYAEELATQLGLDAASQFNNLALDGARTEDILYLLDESFVPDDYTAAMLAANKITDINAARTLYTEAIKKADLITVGIGTVDYLTEQLNNLTNPYTMDWSRYLDEDGVAFVQGVLAEMNATLAESGLGSYADYVSLMIESYAYNYLGFALNYSVLNNKIHEINPDADLVLIGMHNPLKELSLGETAMGEYITKLIEVSNYVVTSYAMLKDNTYFVDAIDVETNMEAVVASLGENPDTMKFMIKYITAILQDKLYATANGHTYIKDQAYAVITADKPVKPGTGTDDETPTTPNTPTTPPTTPTTPPTTPTVTYKAPFTVTVGSSKVTFNGEALEPTVTVTDANGLVVPASEYTVTYTNNKNAGTPTVTVTMNGTTVATGSFTIEKAKAATVKLASKTYAYTGKKITPKFVTSAGVTLSKSDYTITSIKNNKNLGKATVKVKFKGNIKTATKTFTFNIVPKGTKVTKLTKGRKQILVKWARQKKMTTGYEIQVSTSSKFTGKTTKTATIKKTSVTKTTVKNLKAKKTYYVRIRTYKNVGKKTYNSAWSAVKKVKTK